ncbi:MAG: 30S ribosomal protein S12 methylthiotransferase RimO [Myxococcales bacterium]|nr:30S ribosomal protein S12 methylthiotransferase RimO [Myxococcales bacterium]USN51446.1 MAG: 30S ribosomal protein S12 methylthiotransferase RimO [Myxococcales bacterium]
MAKVHLTSLGCPKNRVDAEHMLGVARALGHELVSNADDADTLVINTCAFINEAKEESIDGILQLAKLKEESGGKKKLIVTGCLAQRYAKELEKDIPEVDHFFGTSDYANVADALDTKGQNKSPLIKLGNKSLSKNMVSSDLSYIEKFDLPRINTSPSFSAYLRISEGCDNKCAFCIIPKLRGKQRSRSIDDLVREAHSLAQSGVMELNLIGQDLTAYGFDIPGRPTLAALLNELAQVPGIRWVRQMYAYPRTFSNEYFKAFENKNILPYIDMPVQHGSAHVLRLMRRGGSKERLTNIMKSLRDNIPGLVLRTTVMVGFPGESEEDFLQLCEFIKENKFERLGVFKYSNEENTQAFDFSQQVPEEIKEERFHKLMSIQREVSSELLQKLLGTEQEVVVEGRCDEHEYLVKGRMWSQAPEIDGQVYISSLTPLELGQVVKVLITGTHDYDLAGEVIE